jgi:transcriptional regulator with XRE-family HTH domain
VNLPAGRLTYRVMPVNLAAKSVNQHVAQEIRAEMARRRLSQTALAERLGTGQRSISRRLLGEVELTVGDVDQIAQILGMPIEQLLPERPSLGRRRRAS